MALGVKESVSGKRVALDANGDEVRVCGGKGAVYFSGGKVALRCCGKTSIVATKKMKQSVLRQGDVTLLELRDMFYANGTLTKYEVIDVDIAAAGKSVMLSDASRLAKSSADRAAGLARLSAASPVSAPTPVPAQASSKVVSSYFRKPDAASTVAIVTSAVASTAAPRAAAAKSSITSPKDVSDVASTAATSSSDSRDAPLSATKKRLASVVIVDDDFSNDSDDAGGGGDNGDGEDEEEEDDDEPIVRSKPRRAAKKARAIVESDGDSDGNDNADDDGVNATIAIDSDVSSPREDDAFAHELKLKQEKAGGGSGGATNWMAAFGKGAHGREASGATATKSSSSTSAAVSTRDGWRSASSLKDKRSSSDAKRKPSPSLSSANARGRLAASSGGDDDSGDDEHHTRTHDEVGQLLHECKQIASKLRQSIKSWSSGGSDAAASDAPAAEDNDDNSEQVTIAAINTTDSDRRVVTQDDIPDICTTLVLKPYQVVGINWLLLLCENSVSGVLADEMGLGKTVQTIAFLLLLEDLAKKPHARVCGGPHLVVVPASVLSNWKREFAWIAPTLRVIVYHGSKDDRLDLQDSLQPDDFDVLLTTYSYFERDSCQDDRTFLRSFSFGYMILDEGHSIKNAKTSRFKRISQMRARQRLVLSGTPIQNNLNELLALLSFLMPRMFDHGSDELLLFFDGSEQRKCAKVRQILAPFILRREKKYVLNQLVAKTVYVEMLQPGAAQQRAYTDLIESVIAQKAAVAARKAKEKERKKQCNSKFDRQVQLLLGLDSAKSSSSSAATKDAQASDVAIFTQLRKAANHPVLLRNHYVDDDVLATMSRCLHRAEAFGTQCTIAMVRKELETYCDFELHDLCVQYSGNEELRRLQLPMDALLASAKFDYLRGLLPTLHSDGHRVLIFSQWTKLLDLLEVLMGHMQYRYLRLDGSTDVAERQGMIDTYNEDKGIFVFLLSTRAGGLGINLTAADTVILHDLDFNPTNDEQACDRCHRIGQTKPVSIYKLVTENTVDHDIFKLGESKTQLNHAVLGKLNAHSDARDASKLGGGSSGGRKASDGVTVEMMLASVISSYKKE